LARQISPPPPPPVGRFVDHTQRRTTESVGLPWKSDQLVAETSVSQHTTLTTDKHPCLRWDSKSKSQQASDPWDQNLLYLGPKIVAVNLHVDNTFGKVTTVNGINYKQVPK